MAAPTGNELMALEARIRAAASGPDDALAGAIKGDSLAREAAGDPVTLDLYLELIPGLPRRTVALDAAISAALASARRSGEGPEAVDAIIATHPELEHEIRVADRLDALLRGMIKDPGPRHDHASEHHDRLVGHHLGQPMPDGLGRYELAQRAGHGATSVVFRAVDRLLSSPDKTATVAVKVFPGSRAHTPEAEQILDEARRARVVEHAAVVRVLDYGTSPHGVFIVHQFVEGRPLAGWGARGATRAGLEEVVRQVARAARGAEALHAAGLTHCDIKPTNILVADNGDPTLVDLGAAAASAAPGAGGISGGTVAFLAPERAGDDPDPLAPAGDVFSLGAVLFWALTGRAVAGENRLEALDTLRNGRDDLAPKAERVLAAHAVPRTLQMIARRAIEPDRRERYASAGAFAGDLEAWLARRPVEWTNPSAFRRAALTVRRHPRVCALTATALLVTAGACGAWCVSSYQRHQAMILAHQAELEQSRLEERLLAEQDVKRQARVQLGRMVNGFSRAAEKRGQVLLSLWALDWVHGSGLGLFNDPAAMDTIWTRRIEVLQDELGDLRASGQGDSVEARLLEPSLGLWLLQAGRPDEAVPVLRDAETYWANTARPDDRWVSQVAALRAAAEASASEDAVDWNTREAAVVSLRSAQEARLSGLVGGIVDDTLERIVGAD